MSVDMVFVLGTQERVRNSCCKRAITVRAIEIVLYFSCYSLYPFVRNK